MARSGTKANQSAATDATTQQTAALTRANSAVDSYNKELGILNEGGQIAPNPYENPSYLRNQNLTTAAAAGGANDQAATLLKDTARRTGENTASLPATVASIARQKMRTMSQNQSQQKAQDYQSYLNYEQQLLNNTLAPAGISTNIYGTATGLRNNADTNLANIQNASQGMWGSIIGGAASGIGSAAQGRL